MLDLPAERPDHVAVALALGVGDPVIGLARADLGERGRRLEARLRELDRVQLDRQLHIGRLEAEVLADAGGGAPQLVGGRTGVLVSPPPELDPARGRRDTHPGELATTAKCTLGTGYGS